MTTDLEHPNTQYKPIKIQILQ